MEFGKFPWGEILEATIFVLTGYFSGRYRNVFKNKSMRKGDQ